jgi:hypothetical protein
VNNVTEQEGAGILYEGGEAEVQNMLQWSKNRQLLRSICSVRSPVHIGRFFRVAIRKSDELDENSKFLQSSHKNTLVSSVCIEKYIVHKAE